MSLDEVAAVLAQVGRLEAEHRRIAASSQASKKARSAAVEVTLKRVQSMSAAQSDLMQEAAAATQYGLYRSAHVSAFACLVDGLHQRLDRLGHLPAIAAARKWNVTTVDDLQDHPDYQVAEAARQVGGMSKAQMKTFHGLLHLRNLCAHPTGYAPDLDQTLGYLSSVLGELQAY